MLAQTQSSPARRDNPESVECATWRQAIVGPHHRPTLYCRQERSPTREADEGFHHPARSDRASASATEQPRPGDAVA
jgi:hypothetical protein